MPSWVLDISKDWDSTSLGTMFQFLVILTLKMFFSFLCVNLCLLPLVLSASTTEKSLAPSSLQPQAPKSGTFTHGSDSLWVFSSLVELSLLLQPLLLCQILQSLKYLHNPLTGLAPGHTNLSCPGELSTEHRTLNLWLQYWAEWKDPAPNP